jgi:hypothetical protein
VCGVVTVVAVRAVMIWETSKFGGCGVARRRPTTGTSARQPNFTHVFAARYDANSGSLSVSKLHSTPLSTAHSKDDVDMKWNIHVFKM